MFFGSREASNMVRKIFVTGATSGIGEAIAQAFQAEGAQVIATGATDERCVFVLLPERALKLDAVAL